MLPIPATVVSIAAASSSKSIRTSSGSLSARRATSSTKRLVTLRVVNRWWRWISSARNRVRVSDASIAAPKLALVSLRYARTGFRVAQTHGVSLSGMIPLKTC